MKAGFAERDITPEPGMEKPGGYGKAFHKELHDPCKVRAAVFDDGQKRVALVGVDGLFVYRPLVEAARKGIQERCGIDPEAIMMGASHSHSAGPLGMLMPGFFDGASPLVQKLAYELSSCGDAAYIKHVEKALIEAVCEADKNRVEAKCAVGSGHEDQVAFNRRFRMKDGLSYTHPGQGNPDIVEAAGPIDPEVGVIGAWDSEGKLLGCVVNYACHGTTGPGGTSADWIYYLEQTISGVMGQDAIVVFLNGACGDVTQVDNLSPYVRRAGERSAQFVGGRVGAEAVKVLLTVEPGELTPVDFRTKTLRIKRRKPNPERVKKCVELAGKDRSTMDATEWTFAKEIVILDALIEKAPEADVEVQAIQVGAAVFLANPAEYFCQYGLDIKAGSQFPFTYPVELANDCVGYIPTEDAMGEHGGGYETRLSSYSNLEVGSGTRIAEACVELANGLAPGKAPEPPPAPAWNATWTYGAVPPELE